MRWPDLSRLGVELRVSVGPPALLVARGETGDLAPHGFSQRDADWVRSTVRFETQDLKRWFPNFLSSDIKEMPREQVILSDAAPVVVPVDDTAPATQATPGAEDAPSNQEPEAQSPTPEPVVDLAADVAPDVAAAGAEATGDAHGEVTGEASTPVIEPAGEAPPVAQPKPARKSRKAEKAEKDAEAAEKAAADQAERADSYKRKQDALRAEYLQEIEARSFELQSVPASIQPYYALAMNSYRQALADHGEFVRDDSKHRPDGMPDLALLFQMIADMDGVPGVKAPRDLGNEYQTAAIWTDAGELSVTHYPGRARSDIPEYSVAYSLQKHDTLETYHDRLKVIIACETEAEFEKLKDAGWGLGGDPQDGAVPVKAIKYDGQLITFMGASWGGRRDDGSRHCSAHGWTLTPADEFGEGAVTDKQIRKLWDLDDSKRGDMKGMLVRVRGKSYVCTDPAAMVFRQPAERDSWDFIDTFPMPRATNDIPYLLAETPPGDEVAALRAVHADTSAALIASLLGIDEAQAGLASGTSVTGHVPRTPHAREELRQKLTADLERLPAQFNADLDGYEQHFGVQARDQFEAHVRKTYADLRAAPKEAPPVTEDADESDESQSESAAAPVAIAARQPTRIGQKVLKVLIAAGIAERATEAGFDHVITNPPHADLCIEQVDLPSGNGIALTRYTAPADAASPAERQIDAEVVFRIDQDGQLIVHETCHMDSQWIEVRARDTKFADSFMKELIEQEFAGASSDRKKKIDDAGEKIGGARKDQFASITVESLLEMNEREKVIYVTKDAIWPSIDIAAAKQNGVPLAVLVLGREIRSLIPSGLTLASEAEPFIRVVKGLRDAYENSTTINELLDGAESVGLLTGLIEDRMEKRYGYRSSSEEMVKLRSTGPQHNQFQKAGWDYRRLNKLFWNPHVLARKARVFAEAYEDGGDGYAALLARHGGRRTHAENKDEDGKLPSRPHLASIQRSGLPDERVGRDITAEDLMSRFGFRGVEFGNWLPQDERQDVLNKAYDSFCTLTRVTGFPDRMMSLDGALAVAFGSRGISKAAAHYEPARVVINLTRMNGAGSMAHEYFHALDDWMATAIRKHFDGKGNLPADAMFATEFALEKTKGRRRRPSRTVPVTRDLSWHPDLFEGVKPWFNMAASFVRRGQTLGEYKDALANRTKTYIEAIRKWISYGVKQKGTSEEDAMRHADEATATIDIAELKRLFIRLFDGDDYSKSTSLSVVSHLEELLRWEARLEKSPESIDLPVVETGFFANAKLLDGKKSKPYYSLAREMGARAFECYVFDQIAAMGGCDDYLVHGVDENRFNIKAGYRGDPYPAGEDRKEINRRMEASMKNITEVFVPSYTYETTGDLFAPAPRMAANR